MTSLIFASLVVASYLLGSVPVGLLVAKGVKGVDIREHGSRNIGATNVGRVAGRPWGVGVWLLDAAKGFLPAMTADMVLGGAASGPYAVSLAAVVCGLAAVCGHNFSIFLRFRGGKGVSTSCGLFAYLFPLGLGIAAATWLLAVLVTRYVSVGSMLAGAALSAAALLIPPDPFGTGRWLTAVCLLVTVLIIVRHRSNLARLAAGTENKIGRGKAGGAGPQA